MRLTLFRSGKRIFQEVFKSNKVREYSQGSNLKLHDLTLRGRIALFINNEYNKNDGITKNLLQVKDYAPKQNRNVNLKHINQMNEDQLQNMVRSLKEQKLYSNNQEFKSILDIIDKECSGSLDSLDSKSILLILNFFMQVDIDAITLYKFYEQSLKTLLQNIVYLTKEEILQMMFYIGLKKKNEEAQKMLRQCMKELHKYDVVNLSIEELCIICNSTFKTRTRITSQKILNNIHRTLNDKLHLFQDPALFITFIKSIRHNRGQSEDLLSTISCTVIFNKTYLQYTFTAICHILALFADFSYYDEKLLKLFVKMSIAELKKIKLNNIRNKDITRFLWSLSILNFCEDTSFLIVIIPLIQNKVELGHYKSDEEELVNTILYLWILNRQPIELVKYALTTINMANIKMSKSHSKTRLNLLLLCIYFENRPLFKELGLTNEIFKEHNMQPQLDKRPVLIKVHNALTKVAPEMIVNKFTITYEYPHLNICGITGYKKKTNKAVHIEVLDDYVTVKNKDCWPIGPMCLKLRMLRKSDEALIIINANIVQDMDVKELQSYLKEEINLVC